MEEEKEMKVGPNKIRMQEEILKYLYSHQNFLQEKQQRLVPDERVIQKYKGKKLKNYHHHKKSN